MNREMKKLTIYLTWEEYAELQTIALDEQVSLSAVARARLGFSYRRPGAPPGNINRRRAQRKA